MFRRLEETTQSQKWNEGDLNRTLWIWKVRVRETGEARRRGRRSLLARRLLVEPYFDAAIDATFMVPPFSSPLTVTDLPANDASSAFCASVAFSV